jgi:hypothetical protein
LDGVTPKTNTRNLSPMGDNFTYLGSKKKSDNGTKMDFSIRNSIYDEKGKEALVRNIFVQDKK